MPQWCPATVIGKRTWTKGLFTLRIRCPEVEPFLPGQFLHLGVELPPVEGHEIKILNRPYSVASHHSEELEFFIVLVEEGELTPRLDRLEVGDSLLVSQKAAGSFTLQKAPHLKNLWLMATGTGLAPYIAMVREEYVWENFEKVFIVHGVRFFSDLAYTEELKALEQQFPGRFKLVQTLTRDESACCLRGRINDLFESGKLEAAANTKIEPENTTILLCGNPDMLDSMEELMTARGLKMHRSKTPGNIVHERYW